MDTWKGKLRSAQHAVLELSNIKGLEKAIYREKKPDHHSLPYIFFGSDISLNSWSPCKVFVKKKKKGPTPVPIYSLHPDTNSGSFGSPSFLWVLSSDTGDTLMKPQVECQGF